MFVWTIKPLNYIEQLIILVLAIAECVSNSTFASFVDIPKSISISTVGLKICEITTVIK